MKLPLLIVSFLPKKLQDKYIQKRWDNKADEHILIAFEDANQWIELNKGIMSTPTIREISASCQDRLDRLILPQMAKRNLQEVTGILSNTNLRG